MSGPVTRSVTKRNDAVAKRLELIKRGFTTNCEDLREVNDGLNMVFSNAADAIATGVENSKSYDTGRLINSLDTLGVAHQSAWQAIHLPFVQIAEESNEKKSAV